MVKFKILLKEYFITMIPPILAAAWNDRVPNMLNVAINRGFLNACPKETIPFVDLGLQYRNLEGELNEAFQRAAESAIFIGGPLVTQFESDFAKIHDSAHAISVGSGTDALSLAVRALDIGPGDEVITVPNTWISTAFSISHAGATPVFVDIDPLTHQMDPAALEAAITPQTKAVIPVHMYGHPAPMDAIVALCEPRGLKIIEDVAQAPLARVNDRLCGTMGDIGCYSFYPSKNLGAYGDGGMALTNNDALAERLRQLRNYGQRESHFHAEVGYNSRLDSVQAGILLCKLPHLKTWTTARQRAASWYAEGLAAMPIDPLGTAPGAEPVYHLYVVQMDERDGCLQFLRENGVMAQVHYHGILHLQDCYRHLGYKRGDFPVAEAAQQRILSLPMYPEITESQVSYVLDVLSNFFSRK